MSFTTSCFIRKNTPSLRKKLEELERRKIDSKLENARFILCHADWYCEVDNPNIPPILIDCGEDEELFLALAALRDDSDYMQWFVCEIANEWYFHEQKCRHIDCYAYSEDTDDNLVDVVLGEKYPHYPYHKATESEIIEHFKSQT